MKIRPRMRAVITAATVAVVLTVPAMANAAVYQYFLGTIASGSFATSSDSYVSRDSDNVHRPGGTSYSLTAFPSVGTYSRTFYSDSDGTSTKPLSGVFGPPTIVQCGNNSGATHINVSCWAIQ